MSKTTISLFIVLLIFIGLLLITIFEYRQNPIITSLTKPIIEASSPADTDLSFANSIESIQRGQTVTVAVLIHNPNPHPTVIQLEIAYDPAVITLDSITPGTFFTNPVTALNIIDPVAGRISYALRCPTTQTTAENDCVNASASTVATITFNTNMYTTSPNTSLSFLPKTLIRTRTGKDLLKKANNLELTITSPFLQTASYSAVASPAANVIHEQPAH